MGASFRVHGMKLIRLGDLNPYGPMARKSLNRDWKNEDQEQTA